jgi:hypothetical protein
MYRCSGSVCFRASRIRIRSVGQRYRSEDPDPHPDPYQNVIDSQHSFLLLLTSYCCWYPCSCRRPFCGFRQRCLGCLFRHDPAVASVIVAFWLLADSSAVACVPDFAKPAVANAPAIAGGPAVAGFPIFLTSLLFLVSLLLL